MSDIHTPATPATRRQGFFDTAVKGLKSQGRKSMAGGRYPGCRYRGPGGCKCAIGWLIPDEAYQPRMERKNIAGIWSDKIVAAISAEDGDLDFLSDLQSGHDEPGTFNAMWPRFRALAWKYNLDPKEVPNDEG